MACQLVRDTDSSSSSGSGAVPACPEGSSLGSGVNTNTARESRSIRRFVPAPPACEALAARSRDAVA